MGETSNKPLIHAAYKLAPKQGYSLLLLRKESPHNYLWWEETDSTETSTELNAPSTEEALRLAHSTWKNQSFRTIICGFRYMLPERDEHGINAYFHQMTASYSSPNGVYFDQDLGHHCMVQSASQEALALWQRLKQAGRM